MSIVRLAVLAAAFGAALPGGPVQGSPRAASDFGIFCVRGRL